MFSVALSVGSRPPGVTWRPVRRSFRHEATAFGGEVGQSRTTRFLFSGEKALETVAISWQPRRRQRGRYGTRTGNWHNPQPVRMRPRNQPETGIADERRTRIRNERDTLAAD